MRWDSVDFRDWLRQPAAWAILAIGLVVSLYTWRSLQLEVREAARASFNSTVAEVHRTLDARVRGYDTLLHGVQGLFHAGGDIDRAAFHRYMTSLAPERGTARVRSFSFARAVMLANKSAYENGVRGNAHPGFAIKPPGEREGYLPIEFLEPLSGNEAAFGLDLIADPVRLASIERARDSGLIVAMAPIALITSPGDQGTALRLAIYRRGAALESPEARRRAFAGVASITFRVRDLVDDIVAAHAGLALGLRIVDVGDRSGPRPASPVTLYGTLGDPHAGELLGARHTLEVGGRTWQMDYSAPADRFRTASDVAMPWLALVGGLVITGLLVGLVGSLAMTTRRAQLLAAAMTEDLRRSQSEIAESQRLLVMEHAITRVLAEADSVSAGLRGMLRAFCETEGWDCGRYYLLDVRAGLLRFEESWCIDNENVRSYVERTRDMVFTSGQGLAGVAWQSGGPIWTTDISNDARAVRRYSAEYGIRGAFVFPVKSTDKTLGVAVFTSRVVREPDQRLLEVMGAIGTQVGQFLIRKQAEEALRFVATHDSLTRLPNRVMFGQRLEHAISQAQRHGRRLAVLFIDLDRFKVINDSLGHDAGDAILRDVARRLLDSLRASDTVARLGGDEFVVLLEEIADPMFVRAVAQKLIGVLAQPFTLGGQEYQVTASIGASLYPHDGGDVHELLKNADTAMYRAKEEGRNAFRPYSAALA